MHEGGERHRPRLQRLLERREVDLPVAVVVDHHDLASGALGQLEEEERVGAVLGPGAEHALAGLEREGQGDGVPRARGGVDEGDVVGAAAEELGDRAVDALEAVVGGVGGLVAADAGLELEVAHHGVEDGLGEQRGPRVVEVQDVLAARCEPSRQVHVEARHGLDHGRSVPI